MLFHFGVPVNKKYKHLPIHVVKVSREKKKNKIAKQRPKS